jgi:hypothetical protein
MFCLEDPTLSSINLSPPLRLVLISLQQSDQPNPVNSDKEGNRFL